MKPMILALYLAFGTTILHVVRGSSRSSFDDCFEIDALSQGEQIDSHPDDPDNSGRTESDVFCAPGSSDDSDCLDAFGDDGDNAVTTEAFFQFLFTPKPGSFAGSLSIVGEEGSLTVSLEGDLDFTTGEYWATGPIQDSTGDLVGASGSCTFDGIQDLTLGTFSQTVHCSVCVTDDD